MIGGTEHLYHLACELILAFYRLVAISIHRQCDRCALVARVGQLFLKQSDHIRFYQ
ncbi:hypothetical protein D3C86_2180350 [compost metagenome]